MEWMYPYILWSLLLVPFLAIGGWLIWRSRFRQMVDVWGQRPESTTSFRWQWLRWLACCIALCFAILAASNLRKGDEPIKKELNRAQIIIALDISQSMLAQDISPNRLTIAKNLSVALAKALPLDQVGSIVFAGNAYVNMPLTTDIKALSSFIQNVSVHTAGTQGTAIAEAIDLAAGSVSQEEPEGKVLVLISDGEDHASEAVSAAADAHRKGMTIHTIGIGTSQGSTIPVLRSGAQRPLKDRSGNIVYTQRKDELLSSLASEAGGRYFIYKSIDKTSKEVAQHIQNTAAKSVISSSFRSYRYFYLYFILVAFGCILWASILDWKLR